MDGPKKIILTSHRQWDAWLAMVKQMATIHQLWQYIDPDVENPPPFESPLPPRPQDVNASASRITDLNSEERDLYKLLIQQHALEVDAWSGKDKAMKALHELVCSTIPIGTLTRLLSLMMMAPIMPARFIPSCRRSKQNMRRRYWITGNGSPMNITG